MGWWSALYFFVAAAEAGPGVLLAPSPAELVEAEEELTRRVLEAEAIGRAASRLQNASFGQEDPCEGGYLLRARRFAGAWRDSAQRARVQAQRAALIAQSDTLGPLVDEARLAEIRQLGARAEQQARAWLEFDRLQARSRHDCEGVMQPAPGLPAPTPRAVGEASVPVAVWVLTGTLCPGARLVKGVTVVDGPICMDLDPACSCDPAEALPGAVLTP